MRALIGLLGGYTVLVCGNSLLTTLISLRMLHDERTALDVGLVQSCYYVGFIVGALGLGPMVGRIGPQRAFIGFGALAALAALGYLSFDSPDVWAVLRLITGFSMVGVFTSIESGVNGAVPNERRGRAFAFYLVLTYLGVSAGQFLLGLGTPGGMFEHALVNGLFVAALIPVALIGEWQSVDAAPLAAKARPSALATPKRPTLLLDGLRELHRVAPRSVPACIAAGLLSSAFYALTPVYLARIGYPASDISHAMGVVLIGALLSQWPVGRLSDRLGRRATLGVVAIVSACAAAALVVVRAPVLVDTLLFVYVALTFTLYGVIVSDVNDRVDQARRVQTSATLLLVFSLGGAAGPTLASLFMRLLGAGGLYVFALTVALGLAALSRARSA
ncbi:MFS transporter [Paraburkholderia unamae]|uniref:MFS family arabinose efflux permease n=1 Tax=Paraburkholderia unamae TaxID=219649 RepID=A0ABX5KEV1_9BURK|nr:MFS transporter [Paraburkholderia unamae]PVX76400.1 putative MFS family arabinose efflux permease [Paraburkholderia unamae]CAG9257014.1 Predicted arabinose efflux permease, MFS family [Paraburkholderia unamae]